MEITQLVCPKGQLANAWRPNLAPTDSLRIKFYWDAAKVIYLYSIWKSLARTTQLVLLMAARWWTEWKYLSSDQILYGKSLLTSGPQGWCGRWDFSALQFFRVGTWAQDVTLVSQMLFPPSCFLRPQFLFPTWLQTRSHIIDIINISIIMSLSFTCTHMFYSWV